MACVKAEIWKSKRFLLNVFQFSTDVLLSILASVSVTFVTVANLEPRLPHPLSNIKGIITFNYPSKIVI